MPKKPVEMPTAQEASPPSPTVLHAQHPANQRGAAAGRLPRVMGAPETSHIIGQVVAAGAAGFVLGLLYRRVLSSVG